MYLVLIIVAILVCLLLGVIVLVQNPKGGGLSSNFFKLIAIIGCAKTGDILEKGTWVLAITLMVLSLAINVAIKGGASDTGGSAVREQIQKASKPSGNAPAAAPMTLPGAAKPVDTAKK